MCAYWPLEIERVLFCQVRILGDAAFTRKPNDHKHGERGISRCVWRASIVSAIPQQGLQASNQKFWLPLILRVINKRKNFP